MHKDEAMHIAQQAHDMTLGELMLSYRKFHDIVCNTATVPAQWDGAMVELSSEFPLGTAELLHGAIGLCTESAEILDALKKNFYGKQKPYSPMNIKEELGDAFFYLFLIMKSQKLTLRDIISDNVVKLANRYIEKFDVAGGVA